MIETRKIIKCIIFTSLFVIVVVIIGLLIFRLSAIEYGLSSPKDKEIARVDAYCTGQGKNSAENTWFVFLNYCVDDINYKNIEFSICTQKGYGGGASTFIGRVIPVYVDKNDPTNVISFVKFTDKYRAISVKHFFDMVQTVSGGGVFMLMLIYTDIIQANFEKRKKKSV